MAAQCTSVALVYAKQMLLLRLQSADIASSSSTSFTFYYANALQQLIGIYTDFSSHVSSRT